MKELLISEYAERMKPGNEAFTRIVDNAFNIQSDSLQIEGYNHPQEQMLTAALAICLNQEILKRSHCTHRAVVAAVGLYFESFPDNLIMTLAQRHPGTFQMIKVGEGKDATRIFMAYGYNNWFGNDVDNLDCKIMPGAPDEVPIESLVHLDGRPMTSVDDYDNACPKRTKNLECNIQHAEADVISSTLRTFQSLGISPAEKTILACTWVPCPDCMEKIKDQKQVYGENIEVFPIYTAANDEDDRNMALEARKVLNPNGRDHIHGPYIEVPKKNGYGWFPVMKDTPGLIKESLERKTPIDRKINKLLLRAIELSKS